VTGAGGGGRSLPHRRSAEACLPRGGAVFGRLGAPRSTLGCPPPLLLWRLLLLLLTASIGSVAAQYSYSGSGTFGVGVVGWPYTDNMAITVLLYV
jgi:hypothetical protein